MNMASDHYFTILFLLCLMFDLLWVPSEIRDSLMHF